MSHVQLCMRHATCHLYHIYTNKHFVALLVYFNFSTTTTFDGVHSDMIMIIWNKRTTSMRYDGVFVITDDVDIRSIRNLWCTNANIKSNYSDRLDHVRHIPIKRNEVKKLMTSTRLFVHLFQYCRWHPCEKEMLTRECVDINAAAETRSVHCTAFRKDFCDRLFCIAKSVQSVSNVRLSNIV